MSVLSDHYDAENANREESTLPDPTKKIWDTIILGAGISGLAAARCAAAAGKSVLLVDKGRRIGGRVSTRRADGFVFNHGAQFLTARDPEFAAICETGIAQGSLTKWPFDGRDALIGAPFMRAFPMFLGTDLSIIPDCQIATISQAGGCVEFAGPNGIVMRGRSAIISAPAPQTAKLLADIAPELAETATHATYAPCWTALFGFDQPPSDITTDALPIRDKGIIAWAGWEQSRPTNNHAPDQKHGQKHDQTHNKAALTIQATAHWSEDHINQDRPENLAALKSAYEEATQSELGTPAYAAAHRWLYAKVITAAPEAMPRLSSCKKIAIAGDWLGGARIEHAYLSGIAAARLLDN